MPDGKPEDAKVIRIREKFVQSREVERAVGEKRIMKYGAKRIKVKDRQKGEREGKEQDG